MNSHDAVQPRPPWLEGAARLVQLSDVALEPGKSSERFQLIERTAYFLAERRGFKSGHELEDWLAAEREIDSALAGR